MGQFLPESETFTPDEVDETPVVGETDTVKKPLSPKTK